MEWIILHKTGIQCRAQDVGNSRVIQQNGGEVHVYPNTEVNQCTKEFSRITNRTRGISEACVVAKAIDVFSGVV